MSVTTGGFSVILPTRIIDRLGFGDLLDQRLRIFLLAGLHAGGDLGELVGGDDVDRQGFFGGSDFEGFGRKRHQPPPDHEDVQGDRRYQCLVDLHLHAVP